MNAPVVLSDVSSRYVFVWLQQRFQKSSERTIVVFGRHMHVIPANTLNYLSFCIWEVHRVLPPQLHGVLQLQGVCVCWPIWLSLHSSGKECDESCPSTRIDDRDRRPIGVSRPPILQPGSGGDVWSCGRPL